MPILTIQLPGLPSVSHVLKDETMTIGRMKGNTIVIEDSSISLMHAKITRKDGAFLLKDLNSTNGTMVNGQPITEARLHDLDRVRFADVTAQFLAEETVSAVQSSPSPEQSAKAQPAAVSAAAPAVRPAPVAKPARFPIPALDLRRLVTSLVPYIGGSVALTVISLVVWNFFHLNRVSTAKRDNPDAPVSLLNEKRAFTDGRNQTTAPEKRATPNPAPKVVETFEPGKENVLQLAKALKNPDAAERRRAATTLHNLGPEAKEAAPALRESLTDSDPEVQMWSALTLINNQSYDKAEIPVLISALQHDNSVVRQVVCLSLALIPYEASEKEPVVAALTETAGKDVDDDVRKAALSVLNIISPDTVPHTAIK